MTAINRHNNSKEAKRHMNAVAGLGCAMCHHLHGPHDPGPVELHHLRGNGWGRGDYITVDRKASTISEPACGNAILVSLSVNCWHGHWRNQE